MMECEYEIWQDDFMQADGSTTSAEAALQEADHYAMMYGLDGPVEVRFYFKREVSRDELLELT